MGLAMLINHDFRHELPPLTERQQQVLDCLRQHMTTKEIARALGISPSMVDQHLRAISTKLGGLPRRAIARLHAEQPLRPAPGEVPPLSALEPSASLGQQSRHASWRENFLAGFLTGLACGIGVVLATMLIVTLLLKSP